MVVDQPYGLWLEPAPDVAMTIGDAAGERFWGRPGAWTRSGGVYLTRPRAMIGQLGNLSASAAVDGLKWPLPDGGHQWRSDRAQGLPQWLEVDLGGPHELNTVYLTWDTDLFGRSPSPQPGTSCTATHYRVLAHVGDQWRVVAEEPANWRRFRRHTFAAVTADRLKIEVLAARNGQEARLYEVRAYRE